MCKGETRPASREMAALPWQRSKHVGAGHTHIDWPCAKWEDKFLCEVREAPQRGLATKGGRKLRVQGVCVCCSSIDRSGSGRRNRNGGSLAQIHMRGGSNLTRWVGGKAAWSHLELLESIPCSEVSIPQPFPALAPAHAGCSVAINKGHERGTRPCCWEAIQENKERTTNRRNPLVFQYQPTASMSNIFSRV